MNPVNLPATGRAWVDVDLPALVRNAGSYQARTGVPLLPMIKADGYGLGAVAVARALLPLAPWGFGVATLEEAAELRQAGIESPLLVFSPLQAGTASDYTSTRSRPVIGDVTGLQDWLAAGNGPLECGRELLGAFDPFPVAPEGLRIQRVMERDGTTARQVRARMASQWPEEKKATLADFTITNDGIQALIPQVLKLHDFFLQLR